MNRILVAAVMLASLSTAFADSDPVVWFDMDEANASGSITYYSLHDQHGQRNFS